MFFGFLHIWALRTNEGHKLIFIYNLVQTFIDAQEDTLGTKRMENFCKQDD